MVTTSPRPRCPKAYTILESLIVLAILAVFTWVALALFKHEKKPAKSAEQHPPAAEAPAAPGAPADAAPPAANDAPKE